MAQSIESIHGILSSKFRYIKSIISETDAAADEFKTMYSRWQMESTIPLSAYAAAITDDEKILIVSRYMKWVQLENFLGRLDAIHHQLSRQESKSMSMLEVLTQYSRASIDTRVARVDYKICPDAKCTGRMAIYPHTSEMRCDRCGHIVELKGTILDDSQCYTSSDGANIMPKRGRHETHRHCKSHLDRILALKSVNLSDRQTRKIERWIDLNVTHKEGMTCIHWRRCLKDIGESKLNDYIPYLRQQFSGVNSEGLTYQETNQVIILFDKTVAAIGEIDDGHCNMKYYPFFILKILEIILDRAQDEKRLQSIIDCIHFQRDDTITQNDQLWYQVCIRVPEFRNKFRKTDRNRLQIS